MAKGFVWLKIGALLPGQRPSIKDGGLLKLKYENEKNFGSLFSVNGPKLTKLKDLHLREDED